MVIKCACGRLNGRFGALKREMDINLNDLRNVINACFILHNYCEMNGESIANKVTKKAISYERQFQPGAPNARNQGPEARSKQIHKVSVEYFNWCHVRAINFQKKLTETDCKEFPNKAEVIALSWNSR